MEMKTRPVEMRGKYCNPLGTYKCRFCPETFRNKKIANDHAWRNHFDKVFQ